MYGKRLPAPRADSHSSVAIEQSEVWQQNSQHFGIPEVK